MIAVALFALVCNGATLSANFGTQFRSWEATELLPGEMDSIRGGQTDVFDASCEVGIPANYASGTLWILGIELPMYAGSAAVVGMVCAASVTSEWIWDEYGGPLAQAIYNVLAPGWGLGTWHRVDAVYGLYACRTTFEGTVDCQSGARFSTQVDGVLAEWYCGTDHCMCDSNEDCNATNGYVCMEPGDETEPPGECRPYFCQHTNCN